MSGPARRIVYIVDHFPIVSQTFVDSQILALLEQGHEITVVSFGAGEPPRHATAKTVMERIRLITIPTREGSGYDPRVWGTALRAARPLRAAFWRVLRRVPVIGFYRMRQLVLAASRVGRIEADLIFAHFGPNGVLAAAMREAGMISGRLVTFFHGYDFSSYVRREGRDVYAGLFRAGDRFVVNSRHTRNRMLALGCPRDRIVQIPVGLLPELFEPPAHIDGGGRIRFLAIARLVEKKGLAYAVEALAGAQEDKSSDGLDAVLTIVGEGPQRPELEALAARLGIAERVRFAGARSQVEIRDIAAESDVFLMTSVTAEDGDEEGQGLALQEAQALGLPVIATRHNGFPEGMMENVTGLLVPEREVPVLAAAMRALALNPERRAAMGRAGPEFVRERFDQRRLTAQLMEALAS